MVIDDVGELLDMMNVESGESERSSYDHEQDGGGAQKMTSMLGSCVNIHIGSFRLSIGEILSSSFPFRAIAI